MQFCKIFPVLLTCRQKGWQQSLVVTGTGFGFKPLLYQLPDVWLCGLGQSAVPPPGIIAVLIPQGCYQDDRNEYVQSAF